MSVERELAELVNAIQSCRKCRLHKTRRMPVVGEGRLDAMYMFVGEAPGREEDLQGRPFVGAAGRILTDALLSAGVAREEVYITNVVKCRPPGNRKPMPDEVSACLPYLLEQIRLIRPMGICLLGQVALSAILGLGSITRARGRFFEWKGIKVFPTYHPAATIYRPELREIFFSDIKRFVRKMQA